MIRQWQISLGFTWLVAGRSLFKVLSTAICHVLALGTMGHCVLICIWINEVTDSPRMVQLGTTVTGTTSFWWSPRRVADRFDRLRTIQWQLAVLIPIVAVIGLLEVTEQLIG